MLNEFAYLRETEGNIGQMFGLTIKHQPEFDGTALFDISSHITSYRKHLKDLSKDELEDSQKTRTDELIVHYQKTVAYQNSGKSYSTANTKRIKALYDLSRAFIAIAIIEYKRKGIDGFMSGFVQRLSTSEIEIMAQLVGIDKDSFVGKYLQSSKAEEDAMSIDDAAVKASEDDKKLAEETEMVHKEGYNKAIRVTIQKKGPALLKMFDALESGIIIEEDGTSRNMTTTEKSRIIDDLHCNVGIAIKSLAEIAGIKPGTVSSTCYKIRQSPTLDEVYKQRITKIKNSV